MPAADNDSRPKDASQAPSGHAEIGWRFWLLWMIVFAAWNAWMGFAVHPHTNAYNGYDSLVWLAGNAFLLVLLIIHFCVAWTVGERRRRRSSARAVGAGDSRAGGHAAGAREGSS